MVESNEFKHSLEGRSGDWQVIVFKEPWNNSVKVYLFQKVNGRVFIASISDGLFNMTEFVEGDDYNDKPLLKLPSTAWEAFANTLRQVIPNIEENVVEAELKATKYHLEDMRRLVYKIPLDK